MRHDSDPEFVRVVSGLWSATEQCRGEYDIWETMVRLRALALCWPVRSHCQTSSVSVPDVTAVTVSSTVELGTLQPHATHEEVTDGVKDNKGQQCA